MGACVGAAPARTTHTTSWPFFSTFSGSSSGVCATPKPASRTNAAPQLNVLTVFRTHASATVSQV
jgi:hypothetical protein